MRFSFLCSQTKVFTKYLNFSSMRLDFESQPNFTNGYNPTVPDQKVQFPNQRLDLPHSNYKPTSFGVLQETQYFLAQRK
jgi:hypothetical protein